MSNGSDASAPGTDRSSPVRSPRRSTNSPPQRTWWGSLPSLTWIGLVALACLALSLRLIGIEQVPPGVRFDELVNVKMADHIYAGEWPIYFQEAWGHEPLYHYVHALGMSLLGQTVLGVRIASIAFGTLGAVAAYLVFRRLYGPLVALIATFTLATSFWSLLYSRVGLRHISLPPWVCLAAYAFWRGIETPAHRRRAVTVWLALSGACTGGLLYTYFASRTVPAIFGLFVLYLLLFHRPMLRGRWPGLVIWVVLVVLIPTPMALYIRAHPELEQRLGQVGGTLFAALCAGDLRPLLDALWGTLRMFSVRGDPEWLYNISGRPVLDPLTSIPFYVGLGVSIWRWRDPRRAFLLIWLLVGLTPSLLSWPPGSLGHTIVAQPATFALVALGIFDLWTWIAARTPRWVQRPAYLLLAVIPLVFAVVNGYDYFYRWPKFPQVRHEYQAPVSAAARYLRQNPGTDPVGIAAPYVDHWNPWSKMNFDLYDQAQAPIRWFDASQSMLFPRGPEALLLFTGDQWAALLAQEALVPLLPPNPVLIHGAELDLYRWSDRDRLEQRLAQVVSALAWSSPETTYVPGTSEEQRQALPFPLAFGDRLSMRGYTYHRRQDVLQVVTYWQVLDEETSPLAIFVHVLDPANTVRAGWDGLYVSTDGWQPRDIFVHLHTLPLPADLDAPAARIEIGVYSPVTLQRLPLVVDGRAETAPYDRALLAPLPDASP